jgi:lipopolysaccharide transport system ATP-binding protein
MYVRLAFAVAAHLEPEILIVDEVLAVGDAQFQKKCMGKMGEISARDGRTVLFVSHNMAAVSNLCSQGLLLHKGKRQFFGSAGQAVESYLSSGVAASGQLTWTAADSPGTDRVRIRGVRVLGDGEMKATVSIDRPIQFEIEYETLTPDLPLSTHVHLLHTAGGEVLSTVNFKSASLGPDPWAGQKFPTGRYKSVCTLPSNFLNEGKYLINVAIMVGVGTHDTEVFLPDILQFNAIDTGGMRKEFSGSWLGVVRPRFHWNTSQINC